MDKYKYCVNTNTGTLHIIGGCYHSREISSEFKKFRTEDEAIVSEKKYMKRCKNCFKCK